jgi:hypothetical protein
MAAAASLPQWVVALQEGNYVRALRLLRAAVDEAEPNSYDPAYALVAVGDFGEAGRPRESRGTRAIMRDRGRALAVPCGPGARRR